MFFPSPTFVFMAMVFCHVLEDFFLQSAGFLAMGKQRQWWEKEANEPLYKYDYIPCLFMHSASWAFMIMLPIAWYYQFTVDAIFGIVWLLNAALHMLVDDLKANRHMLNLVQDQCIHSLQIILTYLIMVVW